MAHAPLVKIPESKAAAICARCSLPAQATQLLSAEMTPSELVGALLANKQYVAGIDFMANALPVREAVWWACLTIQHAFGDSLAGNEREACRAAVQWVLKPTDEHRLMARAPAEAAGHATAAGAVAIAANIAGAPSGTFTSAKAVTNSVKLASIQSNPGKIADTQRLFIALALGIAEGRYM